MDKRHSSPVDTSKRKAKLLHRTHRRAATLNDISAMVAKDAVVWGQRQEEAMGPSEKNIEDQWVHINKLPPGPWSNGTYKESPDPSEIDRTERTAHSSPFSMDDYHNPAPYATHAKEINIARSHSASPNLNDSATYDTRGILDGYGTPSISSPRLPMISTFPSYKGQPAASHLSLEVHEVDDGLQEMIKHEAED